MTWHRPLISPCFCFVELPRNTLNDRIHGTDSPTYHRLFCNRAILPPPSLTARLDSLQKILVELRDSMRLYLSSWQTMCKASEAIAEGLATLAGDGEAMEVSPLLNVVRIERKGCGEGREPVPVGTDVIDKTRC